MLKKELRQTMKAVVSSVGREEVERQSLLLTEKVLNSPRFAQSKRISVYVSTSAEIITDDLIRQALLRQKQVFVPQFSRGNRVMRMVNLPSLEAFDGLSTTLWNIRQPSLDQTWQDYFAAGPLDLVFAPGVAFTRDGKRLGHGMVGLEQGQNLSFQGYYDRWFEEHEKRFGRRPYVVGLALEQQILPTVPTSDTDVTLDEVLAASLINQ